MTDELNLEATQCDGAAESMLDRPVSIIPDPVPVATMDGRTVAEALIAIGHMLRAARQAKGWTLAQLAAACHVSESMVCRVEIGERPPRFELLFAMCANLGMRICFHSSA